MLTRTRSIALFLLISLALAACGENGPLPIGGSPTPMPPRDLTVSAVDRGTGDPVAGTTLELGGTSVTTDANGSATLTALPGAAVAATAPGFDPASGTVPASGDLVIKLRSNTLVGTVTDDAGAPLAGVDVFVDGQANGSVATTDEDGHYTLAGVPESGTLIYKRPGYRLGELAIQPAMTRDVAMQPFSVHALYAPAAVFEAPGRLDSFLALIDRTDINAMVIDVKETNGKLYWKTDLPQAVAVGAVMDHPLFDLAELLPKLKARGIYTIARMVSMKDNTTASARPELAVMNAATGTPWQDNIGGEWLDPAAPGVGSISPPSPATWPIRASTKSSSTTFGSSATAPTALADTNLPNTQSFRLPAIQRLFRVVEPAPAPHARVPRRGCLPDQLHRADDQGIGQRPEVIMPYVDYFCPDGLPEPLRPRRVRVRDPERPPLRRDQRHAEAHESPRRVGLADGPFGRGSRTSATGRFAPYTATQVLPR